MVLGVGVVYALATYSHGYLLRQGLAGQPAAVLKWLGSVMPVAVFCSESFRHAGLAHTQSLATLVAWLAVMAQV